MTRLPTRRAILQAGVSIVTGPGVLSAREANKVHVVDAHTHCFAGRKDGRFPYHPRGPYQPEPIQGPDDLLQAMKAADIDYAVIVHPEPYQDDHRYLEFCLKADPKHLKGTCLYFAADPEAGKKMKELAGKLKDQLVALRIHAYDPNKLPPFDKPELKALWRQASELGLAIQLHFEPRYAAGFEPLIKEFPDTRVLIDHLGRPFDGTPADFDVVVRWSRFKNTVMKLSALPTVDRFPHRDIAPVVKRLATAWGAERLMYGGGFQAGVTGKAYRAERERLASYLMDLAEPERAAVLGRNAVRLFRIA